MFKICNKFSNLLKFQNSKGLFENTKCLKGFKSLKDHENVDKKISNINAWFRLVLERVLNL